MRELHVNKNTFAGYIFDFDGTLADTMGVWRNLVEGYLIEQGFHLPEDRMREVMFLTSTRGLEGGATIVFDQLGITADPAQVALRWTQECVAEYEKNVQLKPFAREYLEHLKAQGAKLSIATSGGPEPLLAAMRANGIDHLFDGIVCAAEVTNKGKRVPDVFLEAARRMGAQPADCAVLEDIATNAAVAKSAGFYVIGVHDPNPQQDEAALRDAADRFVMGFQDLL